jgi:hypothetical protein
MSGRTPVWPLRIVAASGTEMPPTNQISAREGISTHGFGSTNHGLVDSAEKPGGDCDLIPRTAADSVAPRAGFLSRRLAQHDNDWSLDEQFADLLTTIAGALSLASAALLGIASLWMLSL